MTSHRKIKYVSVSLTCTKQFSGQPSLSLSLWIHDYFFFPLSQAALHCSVKNRAGNTFPQMRPLLLCDSNDLKELNHTGPCLSGFPCSLAQPALQLALFLKLKSLCIYILSLQLAKQAKGFSYPLSKNKEGWSDYEPFPFISSNARSSWKGRWVQSFSAVIPFFHFRHSPS